MNFIEYNVPVHETLAASTFERKIIQRYGNNIELVTHL